MKDLVDYIRFHGNITSIRDKVDKDYVWFDICQKSTYKDRNGMDRTELSFFSARIYVEYTYKLDFRIGKDVYVQGIPKGYVDKNGHRQNYIHVLEINGIDIAKDLNPYRDGYWNGKKIPFEEEPLDEEDKEFLKEWDELLKELDEEDE